MSMVENGLGIAILPELILKRTPYRIVARELDISAFRNIGFALREKKSAPLAVQTFLKYLTQQIRDPRETTHPVVTPHWEIQQPTEKS